MSTCLSPQAGLAIQTTKTRFCRNRYYPIGCRSSSVSREPAPQFVATVDVTDSLGTIGRGVSLRF